MRISAAITRCRARRSPTSSRPRTRRWTRRFASSSRRFATAIDAIPPPFDHAVLAPAGSPANLAVQTAVQTLHAAAGAARPGGDRAGDRQQPMKRSVATDRSCSLLASGCGGSTSLDPERSAARRRRHHLRRGRRSVRLSRAQPRAGLSRRVPDRRRHLQPQLGRRAGDRAGQRRSRPHLQRLLLLGLPRQQRPRRDARVGRAIHSSASSCASAFPATMVTAARRPTPTTAISSSPTASSACRARATPEVAYVEVPGSYGDGAGYSLRQPSYTIAALNFGPLAEGTMISPRLAPQTVGLGLLAGGRREHHPRLRSERRPPEHGLGRARADEQCSDVSVGRRTSRASSSR